MLYNWNCAVNKIPNGLGLGIVWLFKYVMRWTKSPVKFKNIFNAAAHFNIGFAGFKEARVQRGLPVDVRCNQIAVGLPHAALYYIGRCQQAPVQPFDERNTVQNQPFKILPILNGGIVVAHKLTIIHQVVGNGRIKRGLVA